MNAGRAAAGLLVALGVALALVALDAAKRRAAHAGAQPGRRALVQLLPSPDLAIGPSSRHVRYLTLAEPRAWATDDVGAVDAEPASLLLATPEEALR